MAYSIDQISTMLDAVTGRVTALDGQGLPTGTQGSVAVLQASYNGLKTDVRNLNNTLQQKLNTYIAAAKDLTATVRQVLHLS